MITTHYVATMARYNRWQNTSLADAAASLPDDRLTEDRGAFWGSILKTLNHILWADQVWMARFEGRARPALSMAQGALAYTTLAGYVRARSRFDDYIIDWSTRVSQDWLASDLAWYSGAVGRDMVTPCWLCVTHFFNHQTHHRGQVHAMLTAKGAWPDDTDLFLMPEGA